MALLTDYREESRLARARSQPHLWFTPFSVRDILDQIRREHFPELTATIHVWPVNKGTLACVTTGGASVNIYVHQLLNHSDTPAEVMSVVCKHELLHLRIPPLSDGKRTVQHPPAFWEAEKVLSPERGVAWCWIWINLGQYLKKRPRLERIDVRPAWKEKWNRRMLSISACQELLHGTLDEHEASAW